MCHPEIAGIVPLPLYQLLYPDSRLGGNWRDPWIQSWFLQEHYNHENLWQILVYELVYAHPYWWARHVQMVRWSSTTDKNSVDHFLLFHDVDSIVPVCLKKCNRRQTLGHSDYSKLRYYSLFKVCFYSLKQHIWSRQQVEVIICSLKQGYPVNPLKPMVLEWCNTASNFVYFNTSFICWGWVWGLLIQLQEHMYLKVYRECPQSRYGFCTVHTTRHSYNEAPVQSSPPHESPTTPTKPTPEPQSSPQESTAHQYPQLAW